MSETMKKPVEAHIGKRLRKRRLELGLSLEDVDAELGARKGTTKDLEEGKRFVAPSHLHELGRIYKTDVSFFFQGTGKALPRKDSLAENPDDVAEVQRLIHAYYAIDDPALRRRVVELLKDVSRDEAFLPPD